MNDNQTISLFEQLSAGMDTIQADTGGNNWPPDGVHQCQIVDLVINEGTPEKPVTFGKKDSGIPGFIMYFKYVRQNTTGPSGKEPFSGEFYRLPRKLDGLTEGQLMNVEIQKKKLAGFILHILDRNPSTNLGADMLQLVKKIKSGTVICDIKTTTSVSGLYKNTDSYCISCLSS